MVLAVSNNLDIVHERLRSRNQHRNIDISSIQVSRWPIILGLHWPIAWTLKIDTTETYFHHWKRRQMIPLHLKECLLRFVIPWESTLPHFMNIKFWRFKRFHSSICTYLFVSKSVTLAKLISTKSCVQTVDLPKVSCARSVSSPAPLQRLSVIDERELIVNYRKSFAVDFRAIVQMFSPRSITASGLIMTERADPG